MQELVTVRQAGTAAAAVYTKLPAADSQELIAPGVNNGKGGTSPTEEQIPVCCSGQVVRDVQQPMKALWGVWVCV